MGLVNGKCLRYPRIVCEGAEANAEDRVFHVARALKLRVDACAAVIVFGLRPVEIARGVRIRRLGNLLIVRARGGKLTDHNGQPMRSIVVEAANLAARHLLACVHATRGSLVITAETAKVLCDTMARAGRRAFPRHRPPPTAYNFRHEFATDLKAKGNPEETAQGMGHATARTQSGYGTFRRTPRGGRNPIVRARASRPVRALERARRRPALMGTATATPAKRPRP